MDADEVDDFPFWATRGRRIAFMTAVVVIFLAWQVLVAWAATFAVLSWTRVWFAGPEPIAGAWRVAALTSVVAVIDAVVAGLRAWPRVLHDMIVRGHLDEAGPPAQGRRTMSWTINAVERAAVAGFALWWTARPSPPDLLALVALIVLVQSVPGGAQTAWRRLHRRESGHQDHDEGTRAVDPFDAV